jgi:hypothetical protein
MSLKVNPELLEYLGLRRVNCSPQRPLPKTKLPKTFTPWKFLSVDLCSPLGQRVLQGNRVSDPRHQLGMTVAEYCQIREGRSRRAKAFGSHYHTYSFTKEQRMARLRCIDTGLSLRSQELLAKCKARRCVVRLEQYQPPASPPPARRHDEDADEDSVALQGPHQED